MIVKLFTTMYDVDMHKSFQSNHLPKYFDRIHGIQLMNSLEIWEKVEGTNREIRFVSIVSHFPTIDFSEASTTASESAIVRALGLMIISYTIRVVQEIFFLPCSLKLSSHFYTFFQLRCQSNALKRIDSDINWWRSIYS